MRRAALLAVPLVLSGCSGLGKYFHDTVFWPGYNPNQPEGTSENLAKIRGENISSAALLPASGNIWPAAPQPLPTLKDAANPNSPFNQLLKNPATSFGAAEAGSTSAASYLGGGAEMPSGGSLSIGENAYVHGGVTGDQTHVQALPTSVPDAAGKYLQKGQGKAIIIPNGDGTSTIVNSDGSTRTVKDSKINN
ncbi:hypothetical protein AA106555_0957 [Neokomagataea thailandica NBRC 106555]|uniref:Lipoprotein n=2 Tax=Neokomagataea TaxID=1223423 RepID=A0A4Y6V6J7_9PROT|nr:MULTISPECIES: hypothetical protein [Neokomagataea]QDH25603.1 hypothetical protein D5366_10675 [Neokomagataea tanensis]GBR52565.1 hypothetical protein AA106555_0957 [Neokomagataea thailandica NBRC 106555]